MKFKFHFWNKKNGVSKQEKSLINHKNIPSNPTFLSEHIFLKCLPKKIFAYMEYNAPPLDIYKKYAEILPTSR